MTAFGVWPARVAGRAWWIHWNFTSSSLVIRRLPTRPKWEKGNLPTELVHCTLSVIVSFPAAEKERFHARLRFWITGTTARQDLDEVLGERRCPHQRQVG
jgi:hypothetical protein